jgi:hypothetical protein
MDSHIPNLGHVDVQGLFFEMRKEKLRQMEAYDRGVRSAYWGMSFINSFRERGALNVEDAARQQRRMERRLSFHKQKCRCRLARSESLFRLPRMKWGFPE